MSMAAPENWFAPDTNWQAASTRAMVARLERIATRVLPMENPYQNVTNADSLGRQLESVTNPAAELELRFHYPIELLRAGRSEAALDQFQKLEAALQERNPALLKTNRHKLLTYEAVCNLRLGEQDNCLHNHTVESCLFPIRNQGVHKIQRGSRAALALLEQILTEFPDDLSSRWLLNLAYMTLGEYPDHVPAPWLITPDVFRSDYDPGRFTDVAGRLGVGVFELSGGSILEDFNGDGYLDLMVSSIGLRDQLRFFHNEANGTFSDRTLAAGLRGLTGGLNLLQTDYNNDGYPDVLVLRGAWFGRAGKHPNSLLRNNGNGTFTDVTEEAGLLSFHPTQTAVWFDYNNDGWLDLFIGNESMGPDRNGCELFRNNRDGTFTECSGETGVRVYGYVKAVASSDYDNDGRPDLFLSIYDQPNLLFHNDGPRDASAGTDGPWRFTEDKGAGVAEPAHSFPAWFFDFDNDGWEDLFVDGYQVDEVGMVAADYLKLDPRGQPSKLYRNDGHGRFLDVTKETKMDRVLLAMGSNYGDFDNDGWLDLYLGTGAPDLGMLIPNVALRNAQGKFFQDVTTSSGLGHLQKGHGVSFGDVDNDGDQDISIVMGGAYSGDVYPNALFENPGHGNHWVTLKLEGVKSNRPAIGARIKVVARTEGGTRSIYKTVRSGGSFGASPFRQEIGLGQAAVIERVEILWPADRNPQILTGLERDRIYKVKEGREKAELWPLRTFKLTGSTVAGNHTRHP
jgi:FG-GAP-like repeat/ASPIC and UnbV